MKILGAFFFFPPMLWHKTKIFYLDVFLYVLTCLGSQIMRSSGNIAGSTDRDINIVNALVCVCLQASLG